MAVRVPPNNLEAEQGVLGGLLLNPSSIDLVEDLISPADFYKPAHQKIFSAIQELHHKNETPDLVTVSNLLEKRGELSDIGGAATLAALLESTFSAHNVVSHAKIIREKAILRRMISVSSSIIDRAISGEYSDVESFLDQAESDIFRVAEQTGQQGLMPALEIVKNSVERIQNLYERKIEPSGLTYGFKDLDAKTLGLHAGEFVIIAARPSMGKTAFSLNVAAHAAIRCKKVVAYFSLEMGRESVMTRLLASEARIPMSELRSGRVQDSTWPRLIATAGAISDAPLYICLLYTS
ncbi:MAG: replicative DNA helicase, partial [Bdellovibrionaceae bacterium]|nr:replicative DNA helicase [Pseudobdellovibrionaceae bacterium]